MADIDWSKAACIGADTNIFFPRQHESDGYTEARALCRDCPIIFECGKYACDEQIEHGMWGGLTQTERSVPITRARLKAKFEGYHGDMKGTKTGYYRERKARVEPCQECREAYNADCAERWRARKEKQCAQ